MKIPHQKQLGVSLMELMIVVAVIAIISAIAYPSYRSYIIRANRSEAKIALLSVQVAQERWFLQNSTYATNAQLTPAAPNGLGIPATTPKGNYSITLSGVSAAGYTASAAPTTTGSQASDTTCGTYTIDQSGTKTPADSTGCWR